MLSKADKRVNEIIIDFEKRIGMKNPMKNPCKEIKLFDRKYNKPFILENCSEACKKIIIDFEERQRRH